jgi:EmrB/QacA subfamily drug resistance transporter
MTARPVTAMIGISLVIMLIALDQTIVSTALPSIVAELKGYTLYPWVATGYLLTSAVLIPIVGRLGDIYGRKSFLTSAIAIFTISSVLCALSGTMIQLVVARALQGIGGGMLIGTAFASIPDLFPELKERVRWQVMISSAFGISSAVGPALGGWMTEHFGWRSVFYVNIPLGALALAVVWRYLPVIIHHQKEKIGLDWAGVILLILALSTLLVTSELSSSLGFLSWIFWSLITLSIGFGYLFIKHQLKSTSPITPSHLLKNPVVRTLSLLAFFSGFMLFVLVLYMPLLLQAGFSLSPKVAGGLVTPILVTMTVGSIINGRLITRVHNSRYLYTGGVCFLILGMLLISQADQYSDDLYLLISFAICGLGLGFQIPNLIVQMQATVARTDLGSSSALIQTLRTVGGMFGASIGGLIVNVSFSNTVGQHLNQLGISDESVINLLSSPQILVRELDQEKFQQVANHLGLNALELLQQARLFLIEGVHHAVWFTIIVAMISFIMSLKLPNISRQQEKTTSI